MGLHGSRAWIFVGDRTLSFPFVCAVMLNLELFLVSVTETDFFKSDVCLWIHQRNLQWYLIRIAGGFVWQRRCSPGVSRSEWIVEFLCYVAAEPGSSRQGKQTWKIASRKASLYCWILEVTTCAVVLSLTYLECKTSHSKTMFQCSCERR